ncbi:glutamine--fructose-6-phosphate transaminase (isomerizing) [Halospeciosus flavus]|uniref:Glutamine--fructose-6-phosphate aminotransferase [isomerizing] n=1 Tax=Halospeciosus flavus TaxID=3032283 RepID=A0ABD5Z134_9EURY|nr:glutamine--fructose-6-phosphate transaminase (isomerizing) [Halospeciosus flavus]
MSRHAAGEPAATGVPGYDSAGVAVADDGDVSVAKRAGEVSTLCESVQQDELDGSSGIAHTRWSTHGPPTDENAHPHTDCTGNVAVVHNGVLDNYADLRAELREAGHRFESETDTEVIPHLVEEALAAGATPEDAFRTAVDRLSGSYAVAGIVGSDDTVYAARDGSPLVVGLGSDRSFLASDIPAFLPHTDPVLYVHDGEFARLTPTDVTLTDADGEPVERAPETVEWDPEGAAKGGYDHFMRKEIEEQPTALRQAIRGRVGTDDRRTPADLESLPRDSLAGVERVHFVGMGTSYHAAMYGASVVDWGIPAQAYLSGEYADRTPEPDEGTLVVAVTQSGETADTLRRSDERTNTVPGRSRSRTSSVRPRPATATTASSFGPARRSASPRRRPSPPRSRHLHSSASASTPTRLGPTATTSTNDSPRSNASPLVEQTIEDSPVRSIAREFDDSDAYFFIGRGTGRSVALEGALKFKEITYEHAEGFAASELKHGPLALVTTETPVFAVFTGYDDEALLTSVEEVSARGAPVVGIGADPTGALAERVDHLLELPDTHPDVAGVLANVQLQLFAYHAADRIGRPIDKPRNLAKCVTVE